MRSYYLCFTLSFCILSFVLLISCAVQKDPTPDAHPYAKIVKLSIKNIGTANVVDTVKAGDEVVKLRLKVKADAIARYIYILQAADNGTMSPLPIPTIINKYGTFTGGSSSTYSLKIPDLTSFAIDSFIIEVAVSVRNTTTALNDVYKIWVTTDVGSFSLPADNRTFGSATINLMYAPSYFPITFSTATASLGSQSSKSYGSFLSTSGQITAQDSASYINAPESADIRLVTLTSGKKDNNSTSLWLYSPMDVTQTNPAVIGQTDFILPVYASRTTYFGTYTGSIAFEEVDANTLNGLSNPSSKSVEVVEEGIYIFKTEEGKKGLIRINSVGATTNFGGTGSTTAQNASVSVKVLN